MCFVRIGYFSFTGFLSHVFLHVSRVHVSTMIVAHFTVYGGTLPHFFSCCQLNDQTQQNFLHFQLKVS